MTIKGEFWDEAGQKLKDASFDDVQLVDSARNKWQAMVLTSRNVQTEHKTVIRLESFKVNQNVKEEFFTTRYMERDS